MKVMVQPNLPDHPKVHELAAELDISEVTALGHIVHLWCKTMALAESGVLGGWSAATISRHAGWTGDREIFVSAMLKVRLIDREGDEYAIHDWKDQQGDIVAKRADWAEKKREQWKKFKEKRAAADNGDRSTVEAQREELLFSRLKEAKVIGSDKVLRDHVRGWMASHGFEKAEAILAKVQDGMDIFALNDGHFRQRRGKVAQ